MWEALQSAMRAKLSAGPAPDRLAHALAVLVRRAMPDLDRRYAFPRLGRVVKTGTRAGRADALDGRHVASVQIVTADREPDPQWPLLPDLPLPVWWSGAAGRGLYAVSGVGALVRVGFYDGDPTQPFVDAVLAEGYDVPAVADGELVVAHGSSRAEVRIAANGAVRVAGSSILLDGGSGGLPSGVVRQCDLCAFTGAAHPAASQGVQST